jgi:hypothetical protein
LLADRLPPSENLGGGGGVGMAKEERGLEVRGKETNSPL